MHLHWSGKCIPLWSFATALHLGKDSYRYYQHLNVQGLFLVHITIILVFLCGIPMTLQHLGIFNALYHISLLSWLYSHTHEMSFGKIKSSAMFWLILPWSRSWVEILNTSLLCALCHKVRVYHRQRYYTKVMGKHKGWTHHTHTHTHTHVHTHVCYSQIYPQMYPHAYTDIYQSTHTCDNLHHICTDSSHTTCIAQM